MRLALAVLVVVAAGCDSGTSSDLDVGSFTGYDAQAQARVGGSASHRVGNAPSTVEVELRFGPSDGASAYPWREVVLVLPEAAAERSGDVARVVAESARLVDDEGGGRESTVDGAVTVTSVRTSGGYAEIEGTVSLPFPSGELTGTFRAVDARRPVPTRQCTALDCVTY